MLTNQNHWGKRNGLFSSLSESPMTRYSKLCYSTGNNYYLWLFCVTPENLTEVEGSNEQIGSEHMCGMWLIANYPYILYSGKIWHALNLEILAKNTILFLIWRVLHLAIRDFDPQMWRHHYDAAKPCGWSSHSSSSWEKALAGSFSLAYLPILALFSSVYLHFEVRLSS